MKEDKLSNLEHNIRNNLMVMSYYIRCLQKSIEEMENFINGKVENINNSSQG